MWLAQISAGHPLSEVRAWAAECFRSAGPWPVFESQRRLIAPFLLQGVTTASVGNDGGGRIDVGPLLASPQVKPVGINFATYTGFGTIREKVIGEAMRAPTPGGSRFWMILSIASTSADV